MRTPEELARCLETRPSLPDGDGERFRGYGVMALPFATGHVLTLRRFPASSIGPAYTAVFHRTPSGRWTCYTDVFPGLSCPRYFGRALDGVRVDEISLRWNSDWAFCVSVRDAALDWTVELGPSPGSRLINGMVGVTPAGVWRLDGSLTVAAGAADRFLGAGRVTLAGRAPNGQRFRLRPKRLWSVVASAAVLVRNDLGPAATADTEPTLGSVRLPRRGLFTFGDARFESRSPARAVPVPL